MASAQSEDEDGRRAPPVPLHVPPDWTDGAERIRREGLRSALVIGAIDAGKSTLCRFLVDQARQSGRSAALIDTDVGQKTVGPPACVTMDDPKGTALAFVGTTNPVLGWKRLVEGVHCLAQRTDADLVIANTSGLLAGPGRKLKAAKIDAFQPDLLIALGEGPALETILNDHPKTPVLRLTASPQARRKTDGERRASRREAFRRYFAGASLRTLERIRLSIHPNDPLVPGLLLGLSDPCGNDQGLGLLTGPLEGTAVTILTPAAESVIHRITAGSLVLDEGFSEIRIRAPE